MVVESWGKGKPDYYAGAIPARTEEITTQTIFHLLMDIEMPANYILNVPTIYTVPPSHKLIIGYIKGTCSHFCMFRSDLLVNDEVYCPIYINQQSVVTLSSIGGFMFEAGTRIGANVRNFLNEPIHILGELQGFLYES